MPHSNFIWVAAYVVIVLAIGFWASLRESKEGFLLADRKLNTWQFLGTVVATYVGGGALVGMTAYVYDFGISAAWLFIGAALSYLIFIPYAKRLRKLAKEKRFYTLTEYFTHHYGKGVGKIVALVILASYFLVLAAQFVAGAIVLSAISGWSYTTALLICGSVVFVYTFAGGFWSVVKTDIFQYLIMVIIMFSLGVVAFANTNFLPEQFNIMSLGIATVFAFFLYGLATVFISADLWQRIYAAREDRVVINGLKLSALFIALFGTVIALMGLYAKAQFPEVGAGAAAATVFTSLLPGNFIGLGLVVLFAAIMSSADTAIFVVATNISRDFFGLSSKNDGFGLVRGTRWAMLMAALASILLAYFARNLVDVLVAWASLLFSIAPSSFISFHWKIYRSAAGLSIVAGALTMLVLQVAGLLSPAAALLVLVASITGLLLGQACVYYKSCRIAG